jgi:hypothetical protein
LIQTLQHNQDTGKEERRNYNKQKKIKFSITNALHYMAESPQYGLGI